LFCLPQQDAASRRPHPCELNSGANDADPAYPGAVPLSISGTVRTAADYILKKPGSKIKLKVFSGSKTSLITLSYNSSPGSILNPDI
jgi:hypothetical protein